MNQKRKLSIRLFVATATVLLLSLALLPLRSLPWSHEASVQPGDLPLALQMSKPRHVADQTGEATSYVSQLRRPSLPKSTSVVATVSYLRASGYKCDTMLEYDTARFLRQAMRIKAKGKDATFEAVARMFLPDFKALSIQVLITWLVASLCLRCKRLWQTRFWRRFYASKK